MDIETFEKSIVGFVRECITDKGTLLPQIIGRTVDNRDTVIVLDGNNILGNKDSLYSCGQMVSKSVNSEEDVCAAFIFFTLISCEIEHVEEHVDNCLRKCEGHMDEYNGDAVLFEYMDAEGRDKMFILKFDNTPDGPMFYDDMVDISDITSEEERILPAFVQGYIS